MILGIVVRVAAIVITIVSLARRIAGQAKTAVARRRQGPGADRCAETAVARINDSGVRILHSARALRKVAVGR